VCGKNHTVLILE